MQFCRILQEDFLMWRDELAHSTKAGYTMYGPMATGVHGNTLSPASIKAFPKRMGLEYVDIFYFLPPSSRIPKRRLKRR